MWNLVVGTFGCAIKCLNPSVLARHEIAEQELVAPVRYPLRCVRGIQAHGVCSGCRRDRADVSERSDRFATALSDWDIRPDQETRWFVPLAASRCKSLLRDVAFPALSAKFSKRGSSPEQTAYPPVA
jgi:hypothetical protein